MENREALLQKLRIDREATRASSPSVYRGLTIAAVVLVIVGGAAYFLWPEAADDQATPEADDGTVARAAAVAPGAPSSVDAGAGPNATAPVAAPAPRKAVLNASGYVTARRMATVSSEITGRITEILIEEGMKVKAGQIIARLDDTLARTDFELAVARVAAAKADLANAEADLREGERVLRRARELIKSEFVSEADLTQKQAQVEALKARLQRSRANLKVSELTLRRRRETVDKYLVRAPFAGVIVNKAAQAGEIVSPVSAGGGFTRTGIGTLVDMDSLEIEVDVNEAYIGRVHPGQSVTAVLDAYPDWQIPASVIAIIPTADRAKATVRVRIAIDSKDPRIFPEMGIKVTFHGDGERK